MAETISSQANSSVGDEALLTIGDTRYKIAELSEEAQKLVLAIRDCEEQITSSKRRLNYLEIARRALIQELTSRVPSNN